VPDVASFLIALAVAVALILAAWGWDGEKKCCGLGGCKGCPDRDKYRRS